MKLPDDPFMLLSLVNMKLRDGDYENLADLCHDLGCDEEELKNRLGEAGFEYIEGIKQFK